MAAEKSNHGLRNAGKGNKRKNFWMERKQRKEFRIKRNFFGVKGFCF